MANKREKERERERRRESFINRRSVYYKGKHKDTVLNKSIQLLWPKLTQ